MKHFGVKDSGMRDSGVKDWRRIALIIAPFLAVAAGVIVGRLMH